MTTTTVADLGVRRGSSAAKFLIAANEQEWDIEHHVSDRGLTISASRYEETLETHTGRPTSIVCLFDQTSGQFYSGKTTFYRKISTSEPRLQEQVGRPKIGQILDLLAYGPKRMAAEQRAKDDKQSAEALRKAAARAALGAAAQTDEVQRIKMAAATEVERAEEELLSSLQSVQAMAQSAIDDLQGGSHRIGGSSAILYNSITSQVERAAERHRRAHEHAKEIAFLFGDLPLTPWQKWRESQAGRAVSS